MSISNGTELLSLSISITVSSYRLRPNRCHTVNKHFQEVLVSMMRTATTFVPCRQCRPDVSVAPQCLAQCRPHLECQAASPPPSVCRPIIVDSGIIAPQKAVNLSHTTWIQRFPKNRTDAWMDTWTDAWRPDKRTDTIYHWDAILCHFFPIQERSISNLFSKVHRLLNLELLESRYGAQSTRHCTHIPTEWGTNTRGCDTVK